MEKFRRGILTVSEKIAFGIFGFICVYLFLNSIFSTCVIWYDTLVTYYIKDFPFLLLGGIFALIVITVLLKQKIAKILSKQQWIMGISTVVWFVLLMIFVWNTDIEMVQDQGRIYAGIEGLLSGNTELWEQGGYFYDYPMQNGLVLMFTPVMLLFGEFTYEAVQMVNLIFLWLLALGFYKLAGKIFGSSVARCTYVTVLFFLPLWGYVKFFYGNLIGLSLTIWAVYWLTEYLDDNKLGSMLKCCGCVLAAVVCKSNFSIFVIAMLIVLFLEALREKQLKHCLYGVLLFLCMVAGMKGPSQIVHLLNGCDTGNGIPMIHWVTMGLRESYLAPGWYSGNASEWFAENLYSAGQATQSAWAEIKGSGQVFAQEKDYALRFFTRKFASIWNNPTFESFALIIIGNLKGNLPYWMKDIVYNGGIMNTLLTLLLDVLQSLYLCGVLLYLLCCKKERELKKSVLLIAMVGGVIFHCFWEARCQYTIIYFVGLIPYAFAGFRQCVKNMEAWYRTSGRKEKKEMLVQSKGVRKVMVLLALILVIALWDNTFFTSTVKLQGQEADYVWMCREYDYWKADDFTKDSVHE